MPHETVYTIGNAKVEIEIKSPLLREGLTIRTWTSEAYAPSAAKAMLGLARQINSKEASKDE